MRPHRALSLLAAVALSLTVTPAQAQLGGLGNIFDKAQKAKKVGDSMREIGPEEEEKIGGDLASMILGAAPLVDNADEQHYVNRVGMWLAMHTERGDENRQGAKELEFPAERLHQPRDLTRQGLNNPQPHH